MHSRLLLTLVAVSALSLCGSVPAATPQDVVGQVSQSSYSQYLSGPDFLYTHLGDNRGLGGAQHDLTRTNIYNTLSGFGLSTSLNSFTYSGGTYSNVVATRAGSVTPQNIYIIGAHYDSAGNAGADDNASGVAGVLEAARVLSQYDFASTVVFIAFDREEQGLIGSSAYAAAAKARGDNIRGMISLDMIAASRGYPDRANIYSTPADDPIRNSLVGALTTYGGITGYELDNPYNCSDHASFENQGYPAALLIEYDPFHNSVIHTVNDHVDYPNYIDYSYATNMVRGSVGWVASSAVLVPEPAGAPLLVAVVLPALRRRRAA